jgi:hypothetical protein
VTDHPPRRHDRSSEDEAMAESRRILERVERDSVAIGGSFIARTANRAAKHFSGSDKPQDDPIEVWGTRVGRAIGLVAFVALVIYLVRAVIAQ